MAGRFIDSPNLVGINYASVADYPYDKPIAQDGDRLVYKGRRKVYLVTSGTIVDYYDWEILGDQYRHVQRQAQSAWGIPWVIT